ncbi:MAG: endopeptidase La [Oscillospiraceae bacterium]|nr:endopeptidase La [Oscillospiraceae bacterium]
MNKEIETNNFTELPMIATRGMLAFPQMTLSFDVEREASVRAADEAASGDHLIFLSMQKHIEDEAPGPEEVYRIGTVCRVRQLLRQMKGYSRMIVESLYRAEAVMIMERDGMLRARVAECPDLRERISDARRQAVVRSSLELFQEYLGLTNDLPPTHMLQVFSNPSSEYITWFIAQNIQVNPEDKQQILECGYPVRRLMLLNRLLRNEIQVLKIEQELSNQAQEQMMENQREYFLREELRAIQAELGEEDQVDDFSEYAERIRNLDCPDEVREKLQKELSRLRKQAFGSSEAAVLRSYLDICLELPWGKSTDEVQDLALARKMLDEDHYGLEKVKERILEYLAVRSLSPDVRGGMLCLVGPPGTGKTSIAMSIARATGRELVRVSLGGIHDEAEIRGHRKTYIGSMPGRIINGIIQAKSCNPLMVLDEIDKLGSDYRGDPSSALLEALDPEQNSTFRDHFLEIPFDLSKVFFITTANTTDTIPRALLDRMEVIELSSYTDEEKLQIARSHLLPKQRKKHGLKANQLKISDDAVRSLIRGYTRESGVRQLERELAAICRKAASGIAENRFRTLTVQPGKLEKLLGPVKFKPDERRNEAAVGLVRGLAYTSVGGEVLDVETAVVEGSGKVELTGNLGDVMKESARAAITYIRSRAPLLGIDPDFYKNKDIHIHFPEAAIPKDGPSAGITMCIALISALSGKPVRGDIAMTGEISLRGRVLPIGGLREKTMAALRAGVRTVIIPKENESDLQEIDPLVRRQLNFCTVDHADQVLEIVFPHGDMQKEQKESVHPHKAHRMTVPSGSLRQ